MPYQNRPLTEIILCVIIWVQRNGFDRSTVSYINIVADVVKLGRLFFMYLTISRIIIKIIISKILFTSIPTPPFGKVSEQPPPFLWSVLIVVIITYTHINVEYFLSRRVPLFNLFCHRCKNGACGAVFLSPHNIEDKKTALLRSGSSFWKPTCFRCFEWYARRDLNPRPSESESDTLSNWATDTYSQENIISQVLSFCKS